MRPGATSTGAFLILFVAGCGLYRVNPPLAHADFKAKRGYRYRNLTETLANNTEKNFIVVAMSGGGTRAAALAYGVVEHMSSDQLDRAAEHSSMKWT